jgi:3-phenylpropionate/cinnamic acid dioxygenase small subunit
METGTKPDLALVREIEEFLFMEAELLDAHDFKGWLEQLTEDIHYLMPVRVTREKTAGRGFDDRMAHMDEDYDSLEMRALRVDTEYAWAEEPPSRTRHFVTNVRVSTGDDDDELAVRSNLLLYRTRGDVPAFDLLSAEREDVLRRVEGRWRLAKRTVYLDQSTVLTHNIGFFL